MMLAEDKMGFLFGIFERVWRALEVCRFGEERFGLGGVVVELEFFSGFFWRVGRWLVLCSGGKIF